jgi:glycosyltransferase involved in cell wall biosynthesis
MRVLNLVTNPSAPFFQHQVQALRERGVTQRTLAVPDPGKTRDGTPDTRSVLDYVRLYLRVLRQARTDYDLVHANYGLTAPAALGQPTRPVVVSLWGSDLLGRTGQLCKRCARRADAVIVMSDEMADRLSVDCHVIPHGVDTDLFRPRPRRQARETVGWRHDARHVLFPYGTGRPVKDFPRAERVVDRAREQYGGPVVLHAVSGVPHDQMPAYMNAADALLLTSRSEGSPNAVKEAMACNLPVVATDVGDVRQRLSDVDPSCVCRTDRDLVDGLVAVLRRGERSDGRAAVQALTVERMGERIRGVYDSL